MSSAKASVYFLIPVLCAAAGLPATDTVPNRPPLAKTPYTLLPLGAVKPAGWLERQLRVQAGGLTGHLEEFWPDLGPKSGWLGGEGESWERAPYYLDGLVPLAWLLDDPGLQGRARKWVEWTLRNQRPDGSIGPPSNKDWWPNFVMLKVLTQYQEATGDARVIPLMTKYFAYMNRSLDARPLQKWAVFRWQDQVLTILWLYNRTGDRNLLELAQKVKGQGYDWPRQFLNFAFTQKTPKRAADLPSHGVNNAQALKSAALWYQFSGDRGELEMLGHQFSELDRYHLLQNGAYSGDEHLAGRSPVQGSELCTIVEAMFSLEHIVATTGDASYADRLEKLAFNTLPGTFSKDMWAHQYDQQPNQVLVSRANRDWSSNGPDSNLFGLAPNFGCCTANMHQGWPKFVANLWMAKSSDGLAAVAYGPSRVTAKVRGGIEVTITEQTEYPFRDSILMKISAGSEVTFPLDLRIPAWADQARVSVNGRPVTVKAGEFHTIERKWKDGDRVELVFPMKPRVSHGFNNSIAIDRGPLVYSLRIGEDWRKVSDHPRAPDWAVYPTTPWNYALTVDERNAARSIHVEERKLGEYPFSPDGAPVVLTVKARKVAGWGMLNNSAAPPPEKPDTSGAPEETISLVPYGSAKLRITAFPRSN